MRGSPTRMKLVADRMEMVQSSLRDEMVWRDDSAEADGLKPTATFGGRAATKANNQRVTRARVPFPFQLSRSLTRFEWNTGLRMADDPALNPKGSQRLAGGRTAHPRSRCDEAFASRQG